MHNIEIARRNMKSFPSGIYALPVILAMRALVTGENAEEIGAKIVEDRMGDNGSQESSILSIYIVSKKHWNCGMDW